jgi:hypothetical protein
MIASIILSEGSEVSLIGDSESFPIRWDDPADAELSWSFNLMHSPDVKPPLE